jgi:hypothetical protein
MGTYTASRAVATKLINKFGRTVSFVREDRTAADPAAPWNGPDTSLVTVTVKAAIIEYEVEDIDDQLVRFGDKKALVAAADVEASSATADLSQFDKMIDGTVEWTIMKVGVVDPGDERVLYEVQVRK